MARVESASFRIGPLTTYADPRAFRAWAEGAGVGDEVTYATGPVLGDHPVAALARALVDAGDIEIFQRRSAKPNCFDYCARRKATAAANEDAPEASASLEEKLFRLPVEEARVYQCVASAAQAGEPCPSLTRIFTKCHLKTRRRADYLLGQLVAKGLLRKHARAADAPRDAPMVFDVVLTNKTTRGE